MRLTLATGSRPTRSRQVFDAVTPVAGDVVMGIAILSVDLHAVGQPAAAAVLLWFATATWLFLACVFALRVLDERGRFVREARSPAALTGVAGSSVLGTAFAAQGYYPVAAALLALAGVSWVLLLSSVLSHRRSPVTGASFLPAVATQGLAVLSATLAARNGTAWLLVAAIAVWVLGLGFYTVTVTRFDPHQLLTGHGDHWVAGGALAISALACAKIVQAGAVLGWLTATRGLSADVALAFWCLAMLWLGPLIATEVVRPRLSYDLRRWATVFPLGMYAVLGFAVSQVTGIGGLGTFARWWTWLAIAVGLVVLAGFVRHSWQVVRATAPASAPLRPRSATPSAPVHSKDIGHKG
jgi:tellurite resistance protein TehA-like permease